MPRDYRRTTPGNRLRSDSVNDMQRDLERLQRPSAGPGMGMVINSTGTHYMPLTAPPASDTGFWGLITAHTSSAQISGTSTAWIYNWTAATLTSGGVWSAKTSGATGTARNTLESINASGGTTSFGNGIYKGSVGGGFYILPAPVGIPVWLRSIVVNVNGTPTNFYVFEHSNAYEGSCPT